VYKCPSCGLPFKAKGFHQLKHEGNAWNKGLTKETHPGLAKASEKISASLTGRPRAHATIEKQRASMMGKNKGRKFGNDFREMRRRTMLGVHPTASANKKRSERMKRKIECGEWYPTIPENPFPKPNRKEKKLLNLLERQFPGQYAYTGDGKVTINHLVPDFINCNGRKEVIELYGDYWHRGEDPAIRIEQYSMLGFACLVIWEHELKDEAVILEKIASFRR